MGITKILGKGLPSKSLGLGGDASNGPDPRLVLPENSPAITTQLSGAGKEEPRLQLISAREFISG